jgi:hypothetical protein
MMTPEELAHWKYRLGAIQHELTWLEQGLKDGQTLQADARLGWLRVEERKQGSPATADQVREGMLIPTYMDSIVNTTRSLVEFNEYLLEEARYMIELGKVLIHE